MVQRLRSFTKMGNNCNPVFEVWGGTQCLTNTKIRPKDYRGRKRLRHRQLFCTPQEREKLRYPQASGRATLARATSPISRSLHAHQRLVAEYGRAFLSRSDRQAPRRGVFRDVMDLVYAIEEYVDRHNQNPKPFIWTASANDILEKVKRARKALVNVQSV